MVRGQELQRAGFIGVQAGEISGGARVLRLVNGGSAEAAGIRIDDVIRQVGDHKIMNVEDFVAAVSRLHSGDSVSIRLARSGETRTIRLVVKARPLESSDDARTLYESVRVDGTLRRVIITIPKSEGKRRGSLYDRHRLRLARESRSREHRDKTAVWSDQRGLRDDAGGEERSWRQRGLALHDPLRRYAS